MSAERAADYGYLFGAMPCYLLLQFLHGKTGQVVQVRRKKSYPRFRLRRASCIRRALTDADELLNPWMYRSFTKLAQCLEQLAVDIAKIPVTHDQHMISGTRVVDNGIK